MTDKTATQNLTRTQSTDDPKQMATYLRALGTDVDQRMAAHYHDLARSRVPPFAVLMITEQHFIANPSTVISGDQVLGYDTVGIDTAGMVDLSLDPTRIFLNDTGYYVCGCYMQSNGFAQGSVSDNDTYTKLASTTGVTSQGTVHDNGTGLLGVGHSTIVQVLNPNAESIQVKTGYNGSTGGNAMTIGYAELWAYKLRDL